MVETLEDVAADPVETLERRIDRLVQENELLRNEVDVARHSSRLKNQQIIKHFEKIDQIMGVLDEKAEQERELRIEIDRQLKLAREREAVLGRERERLARTQDQLVESEKMAALGSLVAGVAHEINTPLGLCVTGASFLRDATVELKSDFEGETMTKTAFEDYIKRADELSRLLMTNLSRASELVQSFKKMAVDQSQEERRRFNVAELLDDVAVSLTHAFRKSPITLSVVCDESLELAAQPGAVSQIVTNLVLNALTHAFEPGQSGTVEVRAFIEGGDMVFTVADDGKGMEADTLEHVFEPFYTTARDKGGSGLGLNIAYNLATGALGGTIECESAPGGGALFRFTAPLSAEDMDLP